MDPCESYIVRIYRRDKKYPAGIVGLVEVVETGQVSRFLDLEELSAVLCCKTGEEKQQGKKRKVR